MDSPKIEGLCGYFIRKWTLKIRIILLFIFPAERPEGSGSHSPPFVVAWIKPDHLHLQFFFRKTDNHRILDF